MSAERSDKDRAFDELRGGHQAALDVAQRSLAIARSLADGFRAGVRPPDNVLDAYMTAVERDEARLHALREKARQLRQALERTQLT